MSSFNCLNCSADISIFSLGTKNRNHCPLCLWSKHVDLDIPGDRKSICNTGMKPIGLTYKDKKVDKYSGKVSGEIMIVHQCIKCNSISANRIAGDDKPESLLNLLIEQSDLDDEIKNKLTKLNIELLTTEDKKEVEIILFGYKE